MKFRIQLIRRFSDFDFFISYAHDDGLHYAKSLKISLENQGYSCFLDESEFQMGDSLSETTHQALRKTSVLIVLGTAQALRSPYVSNEIGIALANGLNIIPIDFGETIKSKSTSQKLDSTEKRTIELLGDRLRSEEKMEQLNVGPSNKVISQTCESLKGVRAIRRRAYKFMAFILLFISIAFAAAFAMYYAQQNANEAQKQTQRTKARVLSIRSITEHLPMDYKLQTNLFSAIESATIDPQVDNHKAMQDLIAFLPIPVVRIEGFQKIIKIAYGPEGKRLFAVCENGDLAILDPRSGHTIAIHHFEGRLNALAVDPIGRWIAIAGNLHEPGILILDINTLKINVKLKNNTRISALSFSKDGRFLSAAGLSLVMYETGSWGVKKDRIGYWNGLKSVAFSPDSKLMALGCTNLAAILEIDKGKTLHVLSHTGSVPSVAFSADGRNLVTADSFRMVRLWDTLSGTEVSNFLHGDGVWDVAYAPNGKWLVSGSVDNTARIWDLNTFSERVRFIHPWIIKSVAISPSGLFVATAGENCIWIFSSLRGDTIARFSIADPPNGAIFDIDGKKLAVRTMHHKTHVFDIETQQQLAMFKDGDITKDIAISPDGRYFAIADHDGFIRTYQLSDGKLKWQVRLDYRATNVLFSPNGKHLLATSEFSPYILDTKTGEKISEGKFGWTIAFKYWSKDGKQFLLAGDASIAAFDASNGSLLWRIDDRKGDVTQYALSFDSNGNRLAWGAQDKQVRLLDALTGNEILRLPNEISVRDLRFSPDGKLIATISKNGWLNVYNASNGKLLQKIDTTNGNIINIIISPNGEYLAAVDSYRRAIVIYDLVRGIESQSLPYQGSLTLLKFKNIQSQLMVSYFEQSSNRREPATVVVKSISFKTKDLIFDSCKRIIDSNLSNKKEQLCGIVYKPQD